MLKIFVLMISAASAAFATDAKETKSAYTDLKTECIVVSEPTEEAPIDFFESECKGYAGYRLREAGGDLRYGPKLSYNGAEINLQRPLSFHQMASNQIEWVYDIKRDKEGVGEINFKALIYSISEDINPDGDAETYLHVIRLNGEASCLLGKVETVEKAHKLANRTDARCVELEL